MEKELFITFMPSAITGETEEDKYKCIEEITNTQIMKALNNILQKNNIELVNCYVHFVHVGGPGVADGWVGGHYGAIDADDPDMVSIKVETNNIQDFVTIRKGLEAEKFDFIDELEFA